MAGHAQSVHPSLVKERSQADFVPELLTNLLDGSQEETSRRRDLGKKNMEQLFFLLNNPSCMLCYPISVTHFLSVLYVPEFMWRNKYPRKTILNLATSQNSAYAWVVHFLMDRVCQNVGCVRNTRMKINDTCKGYIFRPALLD